MKMPPQVGDRVIVSDWDQYEITISCIEETDENTVLIHLNWDLQDGKLHTSRVYLHDEGNTWIRYSDRKVFN